MSLVDYASSDDEETTARDEPQRTSATVSPPSPPPHSAHNSRPSGSSLHQRLEDAIPLPAPPVERLPDASLLLSSPLLSHPIGTDHSSRVAAAIAENASRKREANGSTSSSTRSKLPRGNLPHSRNIPDTGGGLLVPPQLRGRSNVVTEDISKLFVRRNPQDQT